MKDKNFKDAVRWTIVTCRFQRKCTNLETLIAGQGWRHTHKLRSTCFFIEARSYVCLCVCTRVSSNRGYKKSKAGSALCVRSNKQDNVHHCMLCTNGGQRVEFWNRDSCFGRAARCVRAFISVYLYAGKNSQCCVWLEQVSKHHNTHTHTPSNSHPTVKAHISLKNWTLLLVWR